MFPSVTVISKCVGDSCLFVIWLISLTMINGVSGHQTNNANNSALVITVVCIVCALFVSLTFGVGMYYWGWYKRERMDGIRDPQPRPTGATTNGPGEKEKVVNPPPIIVSPVKPPPQITTPTPLPNPGGKPGAEKP